LSLTAQDVAQIARLLEESSFDELYLEMDGLTLSIRRQGARGVALGPAPERTATNPAPAAAPTAPSPATSAAPVAAPAAVPRSGADEHEVSAPLLGTFYRAPKPGAPPFVEVGSEVEEDTVIGIIEVMKLMNAVRAGVRGAVSAVLAQDGALVEYGETLLRVRGA